MWSSDPQTGTTGSLRSRSNETEALRVSPQSQLSHERMCALTWFTAFLTSSNGMMLVQVFLAFLLSRKIWFQLAVSGSHTTGPGLSSSSSLLLSYRTVTDAWSAAALCCASRRFDASAAQTLADVDATQQRSDPSDCRCRPGSSWAAGHGYGLWEHLPRIQRRQQGLSVGPRTRTAGRREREVCVCLVSEQPGLLSTGGGACSP